MRTFLLLVSFAFLFSSCSKYQCVSIASDNTSRNERNEFFVDNDTFRVGYSFDNRYGTVHVSVFNKTSKIIAVDWTKSFVIVGNNPTSFYNPELKVQGELDRTRTGNIVTLNATTSLPQDLQFIPPQATIIRPGLSLTQGQFLYTENLAFKGEVIKMGNFSQRIKRASVDRLNSPLQFRIYLTVLPEGVEKSGSIVIERSFYVSEVLNTHGDAYSIYPHGEHANKIIMTKSTAAGTFIGIVGFVSGIALLAAASGG